MSPAARAALLLLASLVRGSSGCYQAPDCIPNCGDLMDQCDTLFCPFCQKAGYCDTTCNFCSQTTSTTLHTQTATTTTTQYLSCPSENEQSDWWCQSANQYCETCLSNTLCDALFCPTCPRAHYCDGTCGYCSITSTRTTTPTSTTTFTSSSSTSSSTSRTSSTTSSSSSSSTTSVSSTTSTSSSSTSTSSATMSSTTSTTSSSSSTNSGTTTTTSSATSTTTSSKTGTSTSTVTSCHSCSYGAQDNNGKTCEAYTAQMCSVNMDDEDFSAMDMCCMCGGGVKSCVDTDFQSTDKTGKGCEDYTYSMCNDDMDDEDFTASTMCCVCEGGGVTEPSNVCSSRTTTSTTTGNATIPTLLTEDEDTLIAGFSWEWLLIALGVIVLASVPICCLYWPRPRKHSRDIFYEENIEIDEGGQDCFVIENTAAQATATTTAAQEQFAMNQGMAVMTQGRYVVRDDKSEHSVYATGCDLLCNGPPGGPGGPLGGPLGGLGGLGSAGPAAPPADDPVTPKRNSKAFKIVDPHTKQEIKATSRRMKIRDPKTGEEVRLTHSSKPVPAG